MVIEGGFVGHGGFKMGKLPEHIIERLGLGPFDFSCCTFGSWSN